MAVIERLQDEGLAVELVQGLIGGAALDATGEPFPADTQNLVAQSDAVLLGAVGGPAWDGVARQLRPEQGLLALRSSMGVFANLRPAFLHESLTDASSLKPEVVRGLDLLIVRELLGDVYFAQPRGIETQEGVRVGFNTMRYDEHEIARIAKVGFEAARGRRGKLCSVDKMNVLECTQLWRDVVNEVGQDYPDVTLSHMLVDNAAMQLVRNPAV